MICVHEFKKFFRQEISHDSILQVQMGANRSHLLPEQIDEYAQLTYLRKPEIEYILRKFCVYQKIPKDEYLNVNRRYTIEEICDIFPQLKHNPFRNQIFKVFSNLNDDTLSFEDFLNLASVFSEQCPWRVKANWAFLIFDFDNDNQITEDDLIQLIDHLTEPVHFTRDEKMDICNVLLHEMNLQHIGSMNQMEFIRAISRVPDFPKIFSFKP